MSLYWRFSLLFFFFKSRHLEDTKQHVFIRSDGGRAHLCWGAWRSGLPNCLLQSHRLGLAARECWGVGGLCNTVKPTGPARPSLRAAGFGLQPSPCRGSSRLGRGSPGSAQDQRAEKGRTAAPSCLWPPYPYAHRFHTESVEVGVPAAAPRPEARPGLPRPAPGVPRAPPLPASPARPRSRRPPGSPRSRRPPRAEPRPGGDR